SGMALVLHNTLTRRKEAFEPVAPPRVRMYNCGPTVYGRAHIGNFRAFLLADLLRRWLELRGYAVAQVMNITDVGHVRDDDPDSTDAAADKMVAAARKERLDPWAIAEKYTALFFQDLDALGIRRAHHYPRATQHIPQMLAIIERLIETGHAYRVDGNVYYSVAAFPAYGRLSGNTGDELLAGARVEVNEQKRDPRDFALWKTDPHHLMQWDSPFGRGFPGWHIECSAMSRALLGEGTLDIHTGGEDNVFPHHECEIAQSEGAFGVPFVKYWVHTRFLQVDGGKMSKSLGNLYTLDDTSARGFSPAALRFLLIRGHYRQVINFTWEALEQSAAAVRRLRLFAAELEEAAGGAAPVAPAGAGTGTPAWLTEAVVRFDEGLDDDLNVSAALDGVFSLLNEANRARPTGAAAAAALAALRRFDQVLGVLEVAPESIDAEVEGLIAQRNAARARKDFAAADAIRRQLAGRGIELLDGKEGVKWRRTGVKA
ncbi:MAG TPA: cysteine--tRNA ligase, partial [Planctomycetota bacterium]|nr:cysteine--tRNA ligase [Planctomycetota bacterium]